MNEEETREAYDRMNKALSHAEGAVLAFTMGTLGEFGNGGTGVVEIRFVDGDPIGVFVRAFSPREAKKPKNERGVIASWECSVDDLRQVFHPGSPPQTCSGRSRSPHS